MSIGTIILIILVGGGFPTGQEGLLDDESQRSLPHHRRAGRRHAVLGYHFYQERQKATGVEINVGKRGISIEKK